MSASSSGPESVELWPEAVETAALLSELITQLRRFIVFRHDTDATAVALWIMFAWIHAVATHSPNLVVTSPEKDCGKTKLLGVLRTSRTARGQRRRTYRTYALSRCRS